MYTGRPIDQGVRGRVEPTARQKRVIYEKWISWSQQDRDAYGSHRKLNSWIDERFPKKRVHIFNKKQVMAYSNIPRHSQKRKRHVKGHKLKWLKQQLHYFILGARENDALVTTEMVRQEAFRMLKKENRKSLEQNKTRGITRVSERWIGRFLHSYKWSIRLVKRSTQLSSEEIEKRIHSFHTFAYRCLKTKKFRSVLNFDEIPISFRGSMKSLKTIAQRGEEDVRGRCNPNDMKRCATLICGAGVKLDKNGSPTNHFFLKPFIVWKGAGEGSSHEIFDARTARAFTPKGVVNKDFFLQDFIPFLKRELDINEAGHTLIYLDSFRSHITSDVLDAFATVANCYCAILPPATTSWIQWIDVFYASSYKREQVNIWHREQHIRRTARQKRQWMHNAVARAHEQVINLDNDSLDESGTLSSSMNVVQQFKSLGYIDLCDASWSHVKCLEGYVFVPPSDDDERDEAKRIEDAFKRGKSVQARKSFQGRLDKWCNPRRSTE